MNKDGEQEAELARELEEHRKEMRRVEGEMAKLKDNNLRWGLRNVAAGGLAAGGLAVGLVTGNVGGLVVGGLVVGVVGGLAVGGLVVGLRPVRAEPVTRVECATSVITASD